MLILAGRLFDLTLWTSTLKSCLFKILRKLCICMILHDTKFYVTPCMFMLHQLCHNSKQRPSEVLHKINIHQNVSRAFNILHYNYTKLLTFL